jgi:hypothetical protein
MTYSDDHPIREPRLTADDQRLLDALVDSEFDRNILSAVSREDNRRLGAICGTLELLRDYPVEDTDETLIHATLARIDRHEAQQAARLNFETRQAKAEARRGGFRIRVPDFITVAAVILIGVGVCWPVLNSVRHQSMKLACSNNLKAVAYAFDQYAGDNNGSLPLALAGIGGSPLSWDRVSNTVNLQPLIQGNYCQEHHLNCPGHEHRESPVFSPSYSYRQFAMNANTGWQTMKVTVILGDLNPIVDAAHAGRFIPPLSVSLNHGGRGQFVLMSDASNKWLEQPIFGSSDNIWLPHNALQLHGGEEPADELDVFLTQ